VIQTSDDSLFARGANSCCFLGLEIQHSIDLQAIVPIDLWPLIIEYRLVIWTEIDSAVLMREDLVHVLKNLWVFGGEGGVTRAVSGL